MIWYVTPGAFGVGWKLYLMTSTIRSAVVSHAVSVLKSGGFMSTPAAMWKGSQSKLMCPAILPDLTTTCFPIGFQECVETGRNRTRTCNG